MTRFVRFWMRFDKPVAVFRLIGVVDLRLSVAAFLGRDPQRDQEQEGQRNVSDQHLKLALTMTSRRYHNEVSNLGSGLDRYRIEPHA